MAPIEPDHNAVERQLKQVIQILYEAMIQVNTYDAHTAVPNPTTTAAAPPPRPPSNGAATPARAPPPPPAVPAPAPAQQPTRDVLAAQLAQLSRALGDVHRLAGDATTGGGGGGGAAAAAASLPRELVTYVENGRNPDIYTREFVELVRRENQLMKGKMGAFAAFRDVLAREMASACPELGDDLARVVVGTGGVPPPRADS